MTGQQEILKAYANQFNISKLKWIFPGGKNGQSSIRNGVMGLKDVCQRKDMVIIHDAIRPMVSQEIISDSIRCCMLNQSAVAVVPCAEAMLLTENRESSSNMVRRDELVRTQTPQSFYLEKLVWAHNEGTKKEINDSIATCTLMIELDEEVFFSSGSEKNLKLTTPDDIEIFKALLLSKKDSWIK